MGFNSGFKGLIWKAAVPPLVYLRNEQIVTHSTGSQVSIRHAVRMMCDYNLYSGIFARCLPCYCDHLSTTSYWYWLLTHVLYLLVECKRVVGTQQVEFFNLCHIYRQWETDSGQYLYQCTVVTRWQLYQCTVVTRWQVSYLLTYSMEQSPPWEANQ